MTTIAWDGKRLAGDKQRSWNSTPLPVTKVFRLEHPMTIGNDLGDAAYRACNPPAIVDNDGEFIRMYRAEFIARFEEKQRWLLKQR